MSDGNKNKVSLASSKPVTQTFSSEMATEGAVLRKQFIAVFATERLVPRVHPDVPGEAGLLPEPLHAHLTHPWHVHGVRPRMHFVYRLQTRVRSV